MILINFGSRLEWKNGVHGGRFVGTGIIICGLNGAGKSTVGKDDLVVIGHSHQNFVKGNVVSVSALGLEGASHLEY